MRFLLLKEGELGRGLGFLAFVFKIIKDLDYPREISKEVLCFIIFSDLHAGGWLSPDC